VIDLVALTSVRFEAVAIDDCELAVMIADQAGALELSGGNGDPARRTPSIEARNSCVSGILSV